MQIRLGYEPVYANNRLVPKGRTVGNSAGCLYLP